MAEISGLVLTVLGVSFQVASAIYSYSRDVKDSKGDMEQLSNEIFAIIGVLEHLKVNQEQISAGKSTDHSKVFSQESNQGILRRVLHQSLYFLQNIHKRLEFPKTRFQAKIQMLKWPFEQKETAQHLQRLERVKTYLILSLMTDQIDLTRQIASEISSLTILTQESTKRQQEEELHEKHKKILEWLSPIDPRQAREKVVKTRINGTGAWLAKGPHFQEWIDSKTSCAFWLNGITGSGKTTLMTTAVDEILSKEGGNDTTAYFHCSFADQESLDLKNILGSILAQLYGRINAYEVLKPIYDQKTAQGFGKIARLEDDHLVELIVERIKDQDRIFILIDAVNECIDPSELLGQLVKISKSCKNVYLFISSINEKGIEECLHQMPRLVVGTLHPWNIEKDIIMLVKANLENHIRLRQHSPELKAEITASLTRGAQGMFRWVCCQLDLLARLRTPGAVRKALISLPPTLDKTYEALLSRVDGDEDRELTREILELLAFSIRPLSLAEICEYLQITPGLPNLDESKRLTNPKDVLNICGSLLHYSNGRILLAHHSVKSYLVSDIKGEATYCRLDACEAHRTIARKCVAYLSLEEFDSGPCTSKKEVYDRYRRYPLLEYASRNWALHAQNLQDLGEPLWAVLKPFLFSSDFSRGNFDAWVQLLHPSSKLPPQTPPLYYAASFGLVTVVKYILEAGADVEVHSGRCGATPINIASFRGYKDVVKLLLEYGADPFANDEGEIGQNAIEWALRNGYLPVLEILTGLGTDGIGPELLNETLTQHLKDRYGNHAMTPATEIVMKVFRARIRPNWNTSEAQRRRWWTLIEHATNECSHPITVAINATAKVESAAGSLAADYGDLDIPSSTPSSSSSSSSSSFSTFEDSININHVTVTVRPPRHLGPTSNDDDDVLEEEAKNKRVDKKRPPHMLIGSSAFLASRGVAVVDGLEDYSLVNPAPNRKKEEKEESQENEVENDNTRRPPSLLLANIHVFVAIDGIYAGVLYVSKSSPNNMEDFPKKI